MEIQPFYDEKLKRETAYLGAKTSPGAKTLRVGDLWTGLKKHLGLSRRNGGPSSLSGNGFAN